MGMHGAQRPPKRRSSARAVLHSKDLLSGDKVAADEGLTAEEEQKCRQAFSEVDSDGSGMLDMKELGDVLENQTGVRPSATEMKVLQARLGFVSSGTEADANWCARCATARTITVSLLAFYGSG